MKKILIFFLLLCYSNIIFSQSLPVEMVSVLPRGFVKNGSVDYTQLIQKFINENNNVIFPDFPILINDSGLKLKSNSTYRFGKNSKLIMKPSDKTGYNMLDCNGKENITITNPVLVGDRNLHKGNTGEWGFGISIRGARNVTVNGAKIYDCFGDGIYIGRLNQSISDNITISNAFVSNSRRNGISITSGTNIKVISSTFQKSNGKGPSSGIDIEPNNAQDELKNIELRNIQTINNENWGLLINLVNLRKDNSVDKRISISIDNLIDSGSKYGMSFWLNRKNNYSKNIKGNITINNLKLMNSIADPIKFYDTYDNDINLTFNGIRVDSENYQKLKNSIRSYQKESKIKFNKIESN